MYEGYRDDAKYILAPFDDKKVTEENSIKQKTARDRRDKYLQLYFDHFGKASKIEDWRKMFGSVPLPGGCTKDNLTIPDTTGSINWGNDSASSSQTMAPVESISPLI